MTVPVTEPSEPPLTVTLFVAPLLVTVIVTVVADEVAAPKIKVEGTVKVAVAPCVIFLPDVLASNAQGVTVIAIGATMPGIVEAVTLKMHEP